MKKILVITLVAAFAFMSSSAEAAFRGSLNFGFYAPAPVYAAPAYAYAPVYAPAPVYVAPADAVYVAPPYPCQVIPVGYDEVEVIYFAGGVRNYAYFPRGVWAREGWGAWRHGYGHRY
jgi:hypothetical protein